MLPFNKANLNAYLLSIGSNPSAIQQFYTELSANFVSALQARFLLTQAQIDYINTMLFGERLMLIQGLYLASQYAVLPNIILPVDMIVKDQSEGGPNVTVNPYIKGKFSGYGTWPEINVKADVEVGARFEC